MDKAKRVPDCHPDKPYAGRGLCRMCYMRAQREGVLAELPKRGALKLIPACHPDRDYQAKGLCAECYGRQHRELAGDKRREDSRRWRRENPDRVREYKRAHPGQRVASDRNYYQRNPDAYWARNLRNKYGLTAHEFQALAEAQSHACAICRRPESRRRLGVDHDHATGAIRGLLCENCNRGIGLFGDSIERVEAALAYLRQYA